MPKKSSRGKSGVGARFRELRLEVVLEVIVTEDELDELEELDELGYEEEYEGAVGRGGGSWSHSSGIARDTPQPRTDRAIACASEVPT